MSEFDVEYDVIVIGGGGSGKSAAYTIATESDLSVCLLEKMEETGGTSRFAEGTCASESCEQNARTVPDFSGELPEGAHYPTHEEHMKRYIDYSHHRANPDVVRSFVWNSGETIEILKNIGVEWTMVSVYAFEQPLELYTFHRPEGLGERVQELLLRACVNEGIDIFTSTPAEKLIVEEGRVVGVVARDVDGNQLSMGAKAVILASGGFGNNMDLVRKYSWMPKVADVSIQCTPTENTGDGLRMAVEAGGAIADIGALMISSRAYKKTRESPLTAAGFQPTLWVNKRAKRFCDESVAHSFADTGNTNALCEDGLMYVILDRAMLDHFEKNGSEIGLGDFIPYKQKVSGVDEAVREAERAHDGSAWKADTIEELAASVGLDVDAFTQTVAHYNELCEKGHDEDFLKPSKYLFPITTPPYYCVLKSPSVLVSLGGIRVNGDMQVTNDKYEPIPGLYAVGLDATGLYGDTYNLDCPGTANGFAHTSGRIAARHAIETIKSE